MSEKITINAVHERDAKKFWKKLKLKDNEPCFVCASDVTSTTFAALGSYEGKVVVCCEVGSCFLDFNYKIKRR